MEFVVHGTHPWQLCRSCDYIAQGWGAQRLYPGCNSLQINATLKELRLAEGVTCSEFFLLIYCDKFQLRITPTAKRNSYRVAILVGSLTQGSVLRPQPWAGETQLRQSCCCLRGVQPEAPPQPSPRTWSSILLWVKALDINIISFGENIGRAQTIVTQPIWSPVQNSFQSRWC